MKAKTPGNKSVRMKEALEQQAKALGLTDQQAINRYVQTRLKRHNQGIDVSPVDFEDPQEKW